MKNHLLFIALAFCAMTSKAQIDPQSPWTWMKGDTVTNQFSKYGTRGLPHTLNKPGSRQYSSTWRDNSGQLWLFGGTGLSSNSEGFLNDLWKFDPVQNKWTWVHGDTLVDQASTYGIKGVASPTNNPGGQYAGSTWKDLDGNFWLFGGFGVSDGDIGLLNALWKFEIETNTWIWIHGSQNRDELAVYGVQGIPHADNIPGARFGSQTWTDSNGKLWLFGGWGYNEESGGCLNDLWNFDPTTNQWTWVKGSNQYDALANYGIRGIVHIDNLPGGRFYSSSWVDYQGNFWLFGGEGYDESAAGKLSDLWKYDPISNTWTWVNGPSSIDQTGIYGSLGTASNEASPGGRYSHNSWVDPYGNFWMFGGYGYDKNSTGYLNDLWKYSIATNQWTWVKGDSTSDVNGVYGIQGQVSPFTKSGARISGISWSDVLGNLWLFGGFGFGNNTEGMLNDLWKINGSLWPLPVKLKTFEGSLVDNKVFLKWSVSDEEQIHTYEIQKSRNGRDFQTIGNTSPKNLGLDEKYSFTDFTPFTLNNSTSYYRIRIVGMDGKSIYSQVLRFSHYLNQGSLSIYPNPASDLLTVSFQKSKPGNSSILIHDMNGRLVRQLGVQTTGVQVARTIDISSLPSSTFMITVYNDESKLQQLFIKN